MTYPLQEARIQVINLLEQGLKNLKLDCEIKLEIPAENLGDFAFPCFALAPIAKKSPNVIAEELSKKIGKSEWVEIVETQGAYLNFFLDKNFLKDLTLKSIKNKSEKYGYLDQKKEKVIIEHTSANPNGPLHVGRARNPIIGDTLVRIYKAAGYNVESQFYLDDMGKQVAILAWGVNNIKPEEIAESDYEKADHKTVGFYQEASKLMQEDKKIAKEIGIFVKKSEDGDENTIDLAHKAYKPVLEGMKESLNRINITVDSYIPESNFIFDKSVNTVIEKLKDTKFSGTEDGAYFLDMEPFGVQGRNTKFFFLRKDGTTLYATRDIAYHLWKGTQADILVNVLGEDHKLESKQVEVGLELMEAKKIPRIVFYSFVSLPGGKMSTREGRVVYLDDLIEEIVNRAFEEVKKRRGKELCEKAMKEISEIIGIGALRYNIIKVQPEKDIIFKWEEAINFEGNSAPFIQYSHARACSILKKAGKLEKDIDANKLKHNSEISLIKKLSEFPLIINESCLSCRPHLISTYLFELASKFNQFYRDCPVIAEKDEKTKNARTVIVDATRIVLNNGLDILGIVAPKEM